MRWTVSVRHLSPCVCVCLFRVHCVNMFIVLYLVDVGLLWRLGVV